MLLTGVQGLKRIECLHPRTDIIDGSVLGAAAGKMTANPVRRFHCTICRCLQFLPRFRCVRRCFNEVVQAFCDCLRTLRCAMDFRRMRLQKIGNLRCRCPNGAKGRAYCRYVVWRLCLRYRSGGGLLITYYVCHYRKIGLGYKCDIPLDKRKYTHYRITMHTREIEKSTQSFLATGKFSVTPPGIGTRFYLKKAAANRKEWLGCPQTPR